jgi:hypothetical protein
VEPKLVVEAESIRTTNSQSLFGKVYLAEEPTTYFPELGWTDFVGSILDHCLKVVAELGPSEHGRVTFLDGPFALEFTRLDANRLQIAGKRKTKTAEAEVVNVEGRHDAFMESLLSAAEAVLRTSDARGWQDLPVVAALRARLMEVKRGRSGTRSS